MFGINRLEAYGIGLVILALALAGADFHGRHVQRQLDEDRASAALLAAQKKADDASAKSLAISQESAEKIEVIRSQHEQELDAVRGSLVNRLCRPTPDRIAVPEARPAASEPHAAKQGSADAGRPADLIGLVDACQADSDTLTALQGWVRAQQP